MNYKIQGLTSIILLFIAFGISCYQLFKSSILFGALYLVLIPLGFLILLYFYCRKCPHVLDNTCRHVLFGWLVQKLYKPQQPSKYTIREISLALAPLVVIVMLPQYILFQNRSLFLTYWLLVLIAVVIVVTSVCRGCRNINCKFCPNKKSAKIDH